MSGMLGGRIRRRVAPGVMRGHESGHPVRQGSQGLWRAAHRLSPGQDRADGGTLCRVPPARLPSVASSIAAGRMEASLKLACRSAEMVTREALQIHGGMGYAEESPVSRYAVDARVLSIFEGAEETLALKVVARTLLEAALSR